MHPFLLTFLVLYNLHIKLKIPNDKFEKTDFIMNFQETKNIFKAMKNYLLKKN